MPSGPPDEPQPFHQKSSHQTVESGTPNQDDVDDFLDPQHEDEINDFENVFGDPEEAVQKRVEIMEMVC